MRTKLLLLLFLFILSFLGACDIASKDVIPPLDLTLSFDKTAYQKNESIVATIVLKNIGDENLLVNTYLAVNFSHIPSPMRGIAFTIFDPKGNSYIPDGFINSLAPRVKDFIVLEPDQLVAINYDLLNYMYDFSISGAYRIIANYQNKIDPRTLDPNDNRTAWKGEVNSSEVIITIGSQ